MEKLKLERTQLRRLFTRACSALTEAAKESPPSEERMAVLKSQLEDKGIRLFAIDERILNAMLEDNVDEREYAEEYGTIESYRDKLQASRAIYENCREGQRATRPESGDTTMANDQSVNDGNKRRYRLPKLELKQFDGDVKNWLGFWGQFKKIHDDPDMDNEDKFQYLVQATKANSKARELVESFPPSAESYVEAIAQLKSRFAKDEFLIEVYVRELLSLVISQVSSDKMKLPLYSLFNKLETQLRALKTLGVTTEKYASMLYPLVESSLSEDILKVWERYKTSIEIKGEVAGSQGDKLDRLMSFLRSEVEGEQRVLLARTSFSPGKEIIRDKGKPRRKDLYDDETVPTAAVIFSAEAKNRYENHDARSDCLFCGKHTHSSQECFSVRDMTLEEKKDIVKKRGGCFCCLRKGHNYKKCKTHIKCLVCSKKHFTILCPELKMHQTVQNQNEKRVETLLSKDVPQPQVLLQTLIVNIVHDNKRVPVRALFDSGSQRSYILGRCAERLRLGKTGEERLIHSLFGGVETKRIVHNMYNVQLESIDGNFSCRLSMLDQRHICNHVPRLDSDYVLSQLKAKNIVLSDVGPHIPEIEILIGADILGKLMTGRLETLDSGLVAVETNLGWTLMGRYHNPQPSRVLSSLCLKNITLSEFWDLELLGIRDPIEQKSIQDQQRDTLRHFNDTITRDEEGRYEVRLPWLEGHPPLRSNREVAERRLVNVTKKLQAQNKLKTYQQVFEEWLSEGVIELVEEKGEESDVHYLPHHPVFKETSETTKIRPVFDASAKGKNSPSLNDCLDKGPCFIELIPDILSKFRFERIGVISDIRKAFLQIGLSASDRDYLRFLWWADELSQRMIVFRHRRVVFGVSPSPFLLSATITHHLGKVPCEFGSIAEKLRKSFYVDDCVTSVRSEEELETFINVSQKIMASAKFELRGWKYNRQHSGELAEHTTNNRDQPAEIIVSVLGLLWDVDEDKLFCDMRGLNGLQCNPTTKRELLSIAQKIFDPIGFTCPAMLLPKLLLQETWRLKVAWDHPLPDAIAKRFSDWLNQIHWIGQCKIPRWLFKTYWAELADVTLHTFCDASKVAYAACVFIRMENGDETSVRLVQAKSRVAPLKSTTIPRLELLAAGIGARLCASVESSLDLKNVSSFFWSDSTVVLHWIKREDQWNTFVGNRVTEIRSLAPPDQWRHVPGSMNPADLLSRGCSGRTLLDSQWWRGPDWLTDGQEFWPQSVPECSEEEVFAEKRKTVSSHLVKCGNFEPSELFCYFSRYTRIVRMMGWILRFYFNVRHREKRKAGELTSEEMRAAEETVWKTVQCEAWGSEASAPIQNLHTFRDERGLVRVRTKLLMSEEMEDFKCPIVLPRQHVVVRRLIEETHRNQCHAGTQMIMGKLRENYWIIKGRRTVREVISKCVVCKRYKVKPAEVPFAPLPKDRVGNSSPFEVTGVDLAGPLYLRDKTKVWIALFTCAVYRAVHFELIRSVSAEAFILALRRFIARRGRPSTIYCDNGTNFVGTYNSLRNLDWNAIQSKPSIQQIIWKFNPPTAAWWGGWWERMVRMVKELLRRSLGRASLYEEELLTVLCDCEAVINSRPLTYVADDITDLKPLTPSIFIQPIVGAGVSDFDTLDAASLNRRHRYVQRVRQELRTRFRKEYLSELAHFGVRRSKMLKVGEVVLVGYDNKKRIDWPLGRIKEIFPGKDGNSRVAKVKTLNGDLVRPFQRLYPLEVSTEEASTLSSSKKSGEEIEYSQDLKGCGDSPLPVTTRSGRAVKTPERLDL